jgi:hypothetical protein
MKGQTMQNEPTLEQIAMMATRVYMGGEHSPKWSVRIAFQIWNETVSQMEERKARKEKANA